MSDNLPPEAPRTSPHPTKVGEMDLLDRFKLTPATFSLIGITVLVYLLQILIIEMLGRDVISQYGAKVNEAIAAGEIWRLLTPVFVHVGIWHIFVNMYSLYALGPAVERLFSSRRMLAVYLLSGFSGVVFSLAFSPRPSVGASGAIFGMLGALGAFIFRHRNRLGRAGRLQLRQIVLVTILNLGLGLLPMVDNWGHVGGLVAGIALSWTMGPQLEVSLSEEGHPRLIDRRPWQKVRTRILAATGLLAVLAFAAIFSPFVR